MNFCLLDRWCSLQDLSLFFLFSSFCQSATKQFWPRTFPQLKLFPSLCLILSFGFLCDASEILFIVSCELSPFFFPPCSAPLLFSKHLNLFEKLLVQSLFMPYSLLLARLLLIEWQAHFEFLFSLLFSSFLEQSWRCLIDLDFSSNH